MKSHLIILTLFLLAACAPPATGYINLYNECFDSPDFGDLIADTAPAYNDRNRETPIDGIAHGTPVTILNSSGDTTLIRFDGREVYVPATLISRYNPAGGVEHDPTACSS